MSYSLSPSLGINTPHNTDQNKDQEFRIKSGREISKEDISSSKSIYFCGDSISDEMNGPVIQSKSAAAAAAGAGTNNEQWRWPVPFLFGGLTAMLALISLSLFILACSYWRTSPSAPDGNQSHHRNLAQQQQQQDSSHHQFSSEASAMAGPHDQVVFAESVDDKVIVIMAGDQIPTFLAKPVLLASMV